MLTYKFTSAVSLGFARCCCVPVPASYVQAHKHKQDKRFTLIFFLGLIHISPTRCLTFPNHHLSRIPIPKGLVNRKKVHAGLLKPNRLHIQDWQ